MSVEYGTYDIVLLDAYFDNLQLETVEAVSFDDAIDQALQLADDTDLHLDEIISPDGETVSFGSPVFDVVEATALVRYGSDYVEEDVPSLTFTMALDLLELMHPAGTVVAVKVNAVLTWLGDAGLGTELPTGWRPVN